MSGRKSVETEEDILVLAQALAGLGIFGVV
jgi:hypothetical protein